MVLPHFILLLHSERKSRKKHFYSPRARQPINTQIPAFLPIACHFILSNNTNNNKNVKTTAP